MGLSSPLLGECCLDPPGPFCCAQWSVDMVGLSLSAGVCGAPGWWLCRGVCVSVGAEGCAAHVATCSVCSVQILGASHMVACPISGGARAVVGSRTVSWLQFAHLDIGCCWLERNPTLKGTRRDYCAWGLWVWLATSVLEPDCTWDGITECPEDADFFFYSISRCCGRPPRRLGSRM
jgi:hypothetical protein